MTEQLLSYALLFAQCCIGLAMVLTVIRLAIGPRAQDRVLALDALYSQVLLMLLAFGVRAGSQLYFEAALVMALLGFVGTTAMARFLMRGEVIE